MRRLMIIKLGFLVMCIFMAQLTGCKRPPFAPSAAEDKAAQLQRQCIAHCSDIKDSCTQRCKNSCAQCEHEERQKMSRRYDQYIHTQNVQGKRVALQLQSFRDPLQCRLASCDCAADYRMCVGQCKGQIRKKLTVKPFCC